MLIDTHCHMNMMAKKTFDIPLPFSSFESITTIIDQALRADVTTIINVGTSLIESDNCIAIAKRFPTVFASIGLHPNDATDHWRLDIVEFKKRLEHKTEHKIVAIGECGIDRHYEGYNLERQQDVFRAQIELALEHNLALIVHTRDAGDETMRCLQEFKDANLRGVIHCFSESVAFARDTLDLGFALGIGGTLTYPKNDQLREVVKAVPLTSIILETDAPFLPPQALRGQQNSPASIKIIAHYVADLLGIDFEDVAQTTTARAMSLFSL